MIICIDIIAYFHTIVDKQQNFFLELRKYLRDHLAPNFDLPDPCQLIARENSANSQIVLHLKKTTLNNTNLVPSSKNDVTLQKNSVAFGSMRS
jgi:hypothetical protein